MATYQANKELAEAYPNHVWRKQEGYYLFTSATHTLGGALLDLTTEDKDDYSHILAECEKQTLSFMQHSNVELLSPKPIKLRYTSLCLETHIVYVVCANSLGVSQIPTKHDKYS